MPKNIEPLYGKHLEELNAATEAALARQGYGSLLIGAGPAPMDFDNDHGPRPRWAPAFRA